MHPKHPQPWWRGSGLRLGQWRPAHPHARHQSQHSSLPQQHRIRRIRRPHLLWIRQRPLFLLYYNTVTRRLQNLATTATNGSLHGITSTYEPVGNSTNITNSATGADSLGGCFTSKTATTIFAGFTRATAAVQWTPPTLWPWRIHPRAISLKIPCRLRNNCWAIQPRIAMKTHTVTAVPTPWSRCLK